MGLFWPKPKPSEVKPDGEQTPSSGPAKAKVSLQDMAERFTSKPIPKRPQPTPRKNDGPHLDLCGKDHKMTERLGIQQGRLTQQNIIDLAEAFGWQERKTSELSDPFVPEIVGRVLIHPGKRPVIVDLGCGGAEAIEYLHRLEIPRDSWPSYLQHGEIL